MANINLISARRAERVRMTRITRAMLAAAAGVTALGGVGVTVLVFQLIGVSARTGEVDRGLAKLRPVLKEIEADERERSALQPKLVTLTEAQQRTQRWSGIMEGLKRAIPEETWLTSIAVEKGAPDQPGIMRIDGVTASQTRVGETMFRLTQQPDFYKKVDLRFTQSNVVENRQNVEFELAALLNQPELEKKTDAKKDDPNAPKAK